MENASEPAKTAESHPAEPPPVYLRRMGPAPQGGFEVELKSEAVLILADKMGQVLKDADAPNFVVMTVHHPELGPLDITIQRALGEPLAKQLSDLRRNSVAADLALEMCNEDRQAILENRDHVGGRTFPLDWKVRAFRKLEKDSPRQPRPERADPLQTEVVKREYAARTNDQVYVQSHWNTLTTEMDFGWHCWFGPRRSNVPYAFFKEQTQEFPWNRAAEFTRDWLLEIAKREEEMSCLYSCVPLHAPHAILGRTVHRLKLEVASRKVWMRKTETVPVSEDNK
ncbi:MAG TPA: hypothetical protein VE866_06050 [Candidatus Binatia bacterium]|nr:hypothetical protein [Candidatus Binatia bacterium]